MGSRLERARERLLPVFRRGLDSKLELLDRARSRLESGDREGLEAIRQVAHQLRGTGSSYGLPAVSVAGAALEAAREEHVERALGVLVRLLHEIKNEGEIDPLRVLVFDGDGELAELLADGAPVVLPAGSADEARSYLRTLAFDCVVIAVGSTNEDGPALLEELRATRDAAPCIAVGDAASAPDLVAPVDADALSTAIRSVVERSAS